MLDYRIVGFLWHHIADAEIGVVFGLGVIFSAGVIRCLLVFFVYGVLEAFLFYAADSLIADIFETFANGECYANGFIGLGMDHRAFWFGRESLRGPVH